MRIVKRKSNGNYVALSMSGTVIAEHANLKKLIGKANRIEKDEIMKDMGLIKVKGAVSGKTYWE